MFVPVVLTMEQALAAFQAVEVAFMTTHRADYAQTMHELAAAIGKRQAEDT